MPVRFGLTIPRWRVHLRNYTTRTGRAGSSAVTIPQIWIGRRDRSRVRDPRLIAENLHSAGDDMVSGWQSIPLEAHQDHMLVVSYRSNDPVLQLVGGCWTVSSAEAIQDVDGRHSSRAPLDIWIESEVPAHTPALAAFGDSLSSGIAATLPVHDSWLSLWCRVHEALPVHYAGSGYVMNIWPEDEHSAWTRWQHLARPDACVLAMGSNDVHGKGAELASLVARHGEARRQVEKFISTNIHLATVLPRNRASPAVVSLRRRYNGWLETQGLNPVIPFARAVSDGDVSLRPEFDRDGIHLNTAGYLAMARTVPDAVLRC